MCELLPIPKSELMLNGFVTPLLHAPEVPLEAYPPVMDGPQPLLLIDDVTLDLSGGEGPLGYSGTWVLREGHLYLRWLLGRNHVAWDIAADWFTGDLDCANKIMHIDHGNEIQVLAA